MTRFHIRNADLASAAEILDEHNIPYDIDSGDRIMIEETYASQAVRCWDEEGIDYDEI